MTNILLDKDYTYGLIYRAYTENLAIPYSRDALSHPYSRGVLSQGGNPDIQRELLPALLLYDRVFVQPFDNFVLYTIDSKSGKKESIYPAKETKSKYITIVGPFTRLPGSSTVKEFLDKIPPRTISDLLINYLQRKNIRISREKLIRCLEVDAHRFYDDIFDRYIELLAETKGSKIAGVISKSIGIPYRKPRLDKTAKKQKMEELLKLKRKLDYYEPILSGYVYLAELLTYCEGYGANLKSSLGKSNQFEIGKKRLHEIKSIEREDEYSTLIGVVFKNLWWTRPRSYEDLLRLSGHKNIDEFRNFIHGTVEEIKQGKTTIEKVDKKTKAASTALKSIKMAKRINKITFWFSIPLSVLVAFLNPVKGACVSVASALPGIYPYLARKRYKWALIDVACGSY